MPMPYYYGEQRPPAITKKLFFGDFTFIWIIMSYIFLNMHNQEIIDYYQIHKSVASLRSKLYAMSYYYEFTIWNWSQG